ncbi:DUF4328 domain-containing protein [Gordonia phthalatica]|uniref:DUF4328 domain-containing protein n=1 Tax=Gordonia phthalatica TaxID=1136941 RepID=A0A0N9MZ71_9ACTN|nr:DUF4328 domain-containing protein [Gordonia phthalatica]ALG83349.1 hypothetical protein ACH46_01020 [Gordonia phthalatica]
MLDVCPACRIQAPHRQGREICPRCGGPLTVVDDYGRAVPRQRPVPSAVARPAPSRRPSVNRPPLRWTADRPAEARPEPRAPQPAAPTGTPRYFAVPRWGLVDAPLSGASDDRAAVEPSAPLRRTLSLVTYMLGAAAVAHLIRYVIAVVNRTTPIPAWLDLLSGAAVLVFGTFAVAGMLLALVAFVHWLLAVRTAAYAEADLRDPRPRLHQWLLAGVPLVNVVGAPLLLTEAARCDPDTLDAAADRIRRIAIAWGLVNGVALIAVGYRIGGWFSDSVQVHADGLAVVTLSLAVSAVFAHWVAPRLVTVLTGPIHESTRERRLVAA